MRGLLVGVALLATNATPAAAAASLEVPDPQPAPVRLARSGDRRVGSLVIVVRNEGRKGGRIRVQYLPDRRAPVVDLPRARVGWIQLVDPVSGAALSAPPRIARTAIARLRVQISLPDSAQSDALNGRLSLQLTRDGKAVGSPAVVRMTAARTGSPPWTQIGVAAAVFGTLFAAVAAWLSHKSADQTRRARLEDQLPQLFAQNVQNEDTHTLDLEVRNAGGGLARNVSCCIEADGRSVRATIGAFLPPRERLLLPTNIGNDTSPTAVVYCWDAHGDCYVWSLAGARYKAPRGQAANMTAERAFRLAHGRAPAPP